MLQVNRAAILAPNGQTFEEECWLLQALSVAKSHHEITKIFKFFETHPSIIALCEPMKVVGNCVIVELNMDKVRSVKSLFVL